ncbi:Low affinity vacuolar monovalent cation/H(+) antiporter [Fusarium oxysporum f. sp. albedinis]|nr:Low affinity vacuolar monovalent cation/H(+) antiporter [Fusarium oxysporum f. sp. albedinis]
MDRRAVLGFCSPAAATPGNAKHNARIRIAFGSDKTHQYATTKALQLAEILRLVASVPVRQAEGEERSYQYVVINAHPILECCESTTTSVIAIGYRDIDDSNVATAVSPNGHYCPVGYRSRQLR